MLDLNADVAGEVDFAFEGGNTITAADSVGSTTTADELDCNTSLFTLNFSVLGRDVIHIDDDVNNIENSDDNVSGELQLFPMVPSSPSATAPYWLNSSAAPEFSTGGGVEFGIYKTHLPMSSSQVPQPQVRRSRRGPRSRSSQYRGVTFYRRTGRWESHIWDCGKQVYLGGFDTAHAAARAYDRAAIMFRGVDADINFKTSDYEEDMKQMKNFTKEEFVHLLRRQRTGFPRGNSKYRASVSLPKCNQWQLLEKKAYEKSIIQRNENEAMLVPSLEPSKYIREVNFSRRDGGSGSGLDLNLGISMTSDSPQGDGFAAAKAVHFPSSAMLGDQSIQVEAKCHPAAWGGKFPNFSTNTKDKSAAAKTIGEAGYLTRSQMWPLKMQSQSVVPLQAVPILPSAASSGFAHTVSPCLKSLLCKQRPQYPSFHSLP